MRGGPNIRVGLKIMDGTVGNRGYVVCSHEFDSCFSHFRDGAVNTSYLILTILLISVFNLFYTLTLPIPSGSL